MDLETISTHCFLEEQFYKEFSFYQDNVPIPDSQLKILTNLPELIRQAWCIFHTSPLLNFPDNHGKLKICAERLSRKLCSKSSVLNIKMEFIGTPEVTPGQFNIIHLAVEDYSKLICQVLFLGVKRLSKEAENEWFHCDVCLFIGMKSFQSSVFRFIESDFNSFVLLNNFCSLDLVWFSVFASAYSDKKKFWLTVHFIVGENPACELTLELLHDQLKHILNKCSIIDTNYSRAQEDHFANEILLVLKKVTGLKLTKYKVIAIDCPDIKANRNGQIAVKIPGIIPNIVNYLVEKRKSFLSDLTLQIDNKKVSEEKKQTNNQKRNSFTRKSFRLKNIS